jgi:RimJ/RimL family protein N-acetyltransferase
MAHWREKILADPGVSKKAILVGGQVVGNIVCFERSGQREVGYWIAREHWGKGIATGALRQFLRQVKERPLYAVAARHNAASIRVLQKCGFAIDGERRASDLVDGVVLKLDASEGPETRSS